MAQELTYLYFHLGHLPLGLLAGSGFGGNTYINCIGLGIGSKCRISAMYQPIQSLFYSGLSQTRDAKNTCKYQAARIGPQPRNGLLFPHTVHLSRYTRHGDNDMLIFFDPPTRRGATRIRESLRRGDQRGLFDITLRHPGVASSEHPSQLSF